MSYVQNSCSGVTHDGKVFMGQIHSCYLSDTLAYIANFSINTWFVCGNKVTSFSAFLEPS